MILMPLSATDFDPTEAAVPWQVLTAAGHAVRFATPDAHPGRADGRMLTGRGLGVWKPVLRARQDATRAYDEMTRSEAFQHPIAYADLRPAGFQGLILPGGHAPGMKPYLESPDLMQAVAEFDRQGKPIGAICHGVLLAARSKGADGKSVLHGKKVTCLLRSQEMAAYRMTQLWLGTYYRTYPETTTQAEVVSFLRDPSDFLEGPRPLLRDAPDALGRGFCVVDGKWVTARWPGDSYTFANAFLKLLEAQ